jgi:hypothetical protein
MAGRGTFALGIVVSGLAAQESNHDRASRQNRENMARHA